MEIFVLKKKLSIVAASVAVAPPAKAKGAAVKTKAKAKATAATVALSQVVLTQIGEGGRREVSDPPRAAGASFGRMISKGAKVIASAWALVKDQVGILPWNQALIAEHHDVWSCCGQSGGYLEVLDPGKRNVTPEVFDPGKRDVADLSCCSPSYPYSKALAMIADAKPRKRKSKSRKEGVDREVSLEYINDSGAFPGA